MVKAAIQTFQNTQVICYTSKRFILHVLLSVFKKLIFVWGNTNEYIQYMSDVCFFFLCLCVFFADASRWESSCVRIQVCENPLPARAAPRLHVKTFSSPHMDRTKSLFVYFLSKTLKTRTKEEENHMMRCTFPPSLRLQTCVCVCVCPCVSWWT